MENKPADGASLLNDRLAANTVIDFEDTIAKAEKARSAIFELEQCLRHKNEIAWAKSFGARIEINWVLQFAKELLEAEKHVAANAALIGAEGVRVEGTVMRKEE